MAKDYFKDCKAIINTILDNMKNADEYDDSKYYTIDILNVDGANAKVMVCEDYKYLTKEEGTWVEVPASTSAQNA